MTALDKVSLTGKVAVAESLFGPGWRDFVSGIVWELVDAMDDMEKSEPFLQIKILWITRTITVGEALAVISRLIGSRP